MGLKIKEVFGMEERFNVHGKVQGIFFRKSFVFALAQRSLKGGATNNAKNRHLVHCTVVGPEAECQKLKQDLLNAQKVNSLGAKVEKIEDVDHGIELEDHQANTLETPNPSLPLGIILKI
jgi:acylphosphatase